MTDEAKEAYNSLVEKPSGAMGFLTPSFENKSFHFPEKNLLKSKQSEFFDPVPENVEAKDCNRNPSSHHDAGPSTSASYRKTRPRNLSLPDERMVYPTPKEPIEEPGSDVAETRMGRTEEVPEEVDGNPLRLLRQNKSGVTNVLPLPPKKQVPSAFTRHQRKHPLLIPNKVPINGTDNSNTSEAPKPPPKPIRQHVRTGSFSHTTEEEQPTVQPRQNVQVSAANLEPTLYQNCESATATATAISDDDRLESDKDLLKIRTVRRILGSNVSRFHNRSLK